MSSTPVDTERADAGPVQGDSSSPASFCSSQTAVVICEDFEGAALNPGWSRTTARGLLTREVDGSHGGVGRVIVDKKWELLSENPAAEDYLDHEVPVDPAAREVVGLAFDVNVTDVARGQYVEIAKLASDTFNVHISLQRSDDADIQVLFGQYSSVPPGELVADEEIMKVADTGWHHLEMRLIVGKAADEKNQFWVKADAQPEKTGELGQIHASTSVSAVHAITGLSFVGVFANGFKYAVDNVVVVNTKP